MAVDALDRVGGEREPLPARDPPAMAQVLAGLVGIQRREVVARGDALGELAQIFTRQHRAQFGLA